MLRCRVTAHWCPVTAQGAALLLDPPTSAPRRLTTAQAPSHCSLVARIYPGKALLLDPLASAPRRLTTAQAPSHCSLVARIYPGKALLLDPDASAQCHPVADHAPRRLLALISPRRFVSRLRHRPTPIVRTVGDRVSGLRFQQGCLTLCVLVGSVGSPVLGRLRTCVRWVSSTRCFQVRVGVLSSGRGF